MPREINVDRRSKRWKRHSYLYSKQRPINFSSYIDTYYTSELRVGKGPDERVRQKMRKSKKTKKYIKSTSTILK